MNRLSITTFLICGLFCASAAAGTSVCDGLVGEKKALAQKILSTQHPYDCCDETIAACLKKKNPCPLATRLAESVCRRVEKGDSEAQIVRRLEKRAASMNPFAKKHSIDLSDAAMAGSPDAKVTLVVYACARCPFCSRLVPRIYDAVTDGALKGKVKLYFKAFPLKSHEYSKEGGLAMVAAHRMGQFWPYLLQMYGAFDLFCVDKLDDWAQQKGMDPAQFTTLMNDPVTRDALVASKKEGLANGVEATPQLFINGRRYEGFLEIEEVVDVLLEEYDRP